MSRPLILHFGAGNIGRSLVGSVFSSAGFDVLFVDAAPPVVEALHARRGYRVVVKDNLPPGSPDHIDVSGVDAVLASDAAAVTDAVIRADVIGTSVGARFLPDVLKAMAPGLARRATPVSIILCENLHNAVPLARETLAAALPANVDIDARIGLVATSIGKMVPVMPAEVRARDPLEVWGEAYNTIIADGQAFRGMRPVLKGLELKDNFAAYTDRKLYIHNLGHAVCASLGALRGCTYIWEAMAIPEIAADTQSAMSEAARGLIVRYPSEFTDDALAEHIDDLLRRFRNKALGDTVFRVGRDLPRKLSGDDRFAGALKLVRETGGDVTPICKGIAAALQFTAVDENGHPFPPDAEFLAQAEAFGPASFFARHARLDARQYQDVIYLIAKLYTRFKDNK